MRWGVEEDFFGFQPALTKRSVLMNWNLREVGVEKDFFGFHPYPVIILSWSRLLPKICVRGCKGTKEGQDLNNLFMTLEVIHYLREGLEGRGLKNLYITLRWEGGIQYILT